MSIFDSKGELNAVSQKDALQSIVKMAKLIEENANTSNTMVGRPGLSDQQRDEMVKRALLTTDGKIALGQAMALPIRRNLDYSGVARRALVVN